MVPRILNTFTAQVAKVAEDLEAHYHEKVKKIKDNTLFSEQIDAEYKALKILIADLLKTKNAENFLKKLINGLTNVEVKVSVQHYFALKVQVEQIQFFQKLTGDNFTASLQPSQWITPLSNAVSTVDHYNRWYKFLLNLYKELATHQVQLSRKNYDVKNVNNWGKPNQPAGIYIDKDNYKDFLKVLKQKLKIVDMPSEVDPAKFGLFDSLNEVLNVTLKEDLKIICDSKYNGAVMGSFISLSQVLRKYHALCSYEVLGLNIYAYDTIFIDDSLDLKGRITDNFVMVSPSIQVTTTAKINLKPGTERGRYPKKAKNGITPSDSGEDGKPGYPGDPSPSFMAIAKSFTYPEKLTVIVDGGNGGQGQDGGDGIDGFSVKKINYGDRPRLGTYWSGGHPTDSFTAYINAWKKFEGYDVYVDWEGDDKSRGCAWLGYCYRTFLVYPTKPGDKGGDAGNGGLGGEPGNQGISIVESLGNQNIRALIHLSNKPGNRGISGKPGKVGHGGSNGYKLTHKTEFVAKGFGGSFRETIISDVNQGSQPNGKEGKEGGNSKGIEKAKSIFPFHPEIELNRYKNALRERLSNRVTGSLISSFLNEINRSENVRKLYNVEGYINELTILETQTFSLRNEIDFEPHYQSYIERVEAYSAGLEKQSGDAIDDERLILLRLYTAAYSKLLSLKDAETVLVVDLAEFFKLTKNEIDEISNLEDDKIKITTTDKYVSDIDKKIEEAENLAGEDVTKSIKQTFTDLTSKVNDLVKEVQKLKNDAKTEASELQKTIQQLRTNLLTKRILGSLSIVGTLVGMLGPYGKAAEVAINAGSAIANHFLVKEPKEVNKTEVPDGVANAEKLLIEAEKETAKTVEEKTEVLEDQFKKILKQFEGIGDVFDGIKGKVENLQKEFEESKEDKILRKVEEIQKKLNDELEEEEKKDPTKWEKLGAKAKTAFKYAKNVVKVGNLCYQEYKDTKDDLDKMNAVADEVNAAYDKFQNLHNFERGIYNQVVPLLKTMRNKVDEMKANFAGKSKASLNVQQWKVQAALKQMKIDVVKIVKGFEVEEAVGETFDKLEQAMVVLVSLYDTIQTYESEKSLGNFISTINGQKSKQIKLTKRLDLQKPMINMEMAIRRNLIINQYSSALSALKLTVFPLAKYYFKDFKSIEMDINTDAATAAKRVKLQIEEFIKTFETYKTTIRTGKDTFTFHQSYDTELSLYDWDGVAYKAEIAKLFKGQPILLYADVNSRFDHNAIKVNTVELYFKTRNPNTFTEEHIATALKPYKYSMHHSGFSYFKCDSKFYTINHPKEDIIQSFRKRNDGSPATTNDVYDKLKDADVIISPYTYWEIQLSDAANASNQNFDGLNELIGMVDLQLTGVGQYVGTQLGVCNGELDRYYDQDITVGNLVGEFKDANQLTLLINELNSRQFSENEVFSSPSFSTGKVEEIDTSDIIYESAPCQVNTYEINEPQNNTCYFEPEMEPDFTTHVSVEGTDLINSLIHNETLRSTFTEKHPEWKNFIDAGIELDNLIARTEGQVIEAHSRRRRSPKAKYDRYGFDDFDFLPVNKASNGYSSPLNNIINILLINLTFLRLQNLSTYLLQNVKPYFDNINFMPSWIKQVDSHQVKEISVEKINDEFTFESGDSSKNLDAKGFYNVMDNTLVLVPLFLHFWRKLFGQQRQTKPVSFGSKKEPNYRITVDQLSRIIQEFSETELVENNPDPYLFAEHKTDYFVPEIFDQFTYNNFVQNSTSKHLHDEGRYLAN